MTTASGRVERGLCAAAAVTAAAAVALGALASHAPGLDAAARSSVATAASYALVHGIAVLATHGLSLHPLALAARLALLAGALLFMTSIAFERLGLVAGAAQAAPLGGMLMIGAWLTLAVAVLRKH